jgi:heat shock protein HslJ
MPDLSTDAGLRAALRDVAAWGEPDHVPALAEAAPIGLEPDPIRRANRWARPLVGVTAAVALAIVAVIVTRDPDRSPTDVAAPMASADDLVGRDWRIDVVTAKGERRAIDPSYDAVLRFDGNGSFGGKTCNDFGGDVVISPSSLTFGDEVLSTLMKCTGERGWLEDRVTSLFLMGTAEWTLVDGVLRLDAGDVVVELSERPTGFPTELVQLTTSDAFGEPFWQFGYTEATDAEMAEGAYRYFLMWEGRSAPGTAFGNAGVAVDPEVPLETMWVDDVENAVFTFGTLPPGTVTALFEATDGTPEELTIYVLPDGRPVYGQVVAASKGQVVALDRAGNEIGRGRTVPVP